MNAFYSPTRDSRKDSGLKIEFMLDTGAACSIKNYRTFLETAQFRQPITVVRSKQKTKTYIGDIVPMIGHTTLSPSFDSDREHNLNYGYGLQRHRPQIYLESNFADNTSRNWFSKYQQESSKTQRMLSAMVTCVQQNPTPSSQRYTLLEYLIRFILTPRLSEFGNTHQKTTQRSSPQEPPLFLIGTQSNQDQTLLLYYAPNPKNIFLI